MIAGLAGNEVKGALDPQQMTDVLTAYSAEQGDCIAQTAL